MKSLVLFYVVAVALCALAFYLETAHPCTRTFQSSGDHYVCAERR